MGSNTVHSLVADACQGRLEDVAHYVEMPELGTVVARTGRIGEAKAEEAIAALRSVLERARKHGYEHLLAGATAAVRKAADRDQFLARASVAIGAPVRLISEQREAELSFRGVASRHASRRPWLMVDMGGASTELVSTTLSTPIGLLRIPAPTPVGSLVNWSVFDSEIGSEIGSGSGRPRDCAICWAE